MDKPFFIFVAQNKTMSRLGIMLFLTFSLWYSPTSIHAQSREKLQKEKENIEKEIEYTSRLIKEVQQNTENSLSKLLLVNSQINQRESLLANLNSELALLNRQISNSNDTIGKLTSDLEDLKASYARMIKFAYRSRNSHDKMMFVFSAKDFNQAYLRLKYLQQYSRHRKLQAEKIVEAKDLLQKKILELEQKRKEQQLLIQAQSNEMKALQQLKAEQAETINKLKKQEKDLIANLKEKEKTRTNLQNSIEKLIAEETRKSKEAARKAGKPASNVYTMTPAEATLSDNFAQNKGKLPWPSEKGVITSTFGEHPHPVLPNIKIKNNGIDIATSQGAHARSVFNGVVSGVISIPGAQFAVIIRHGDYLTVYSNLSEVFVSIGQQISTRQSIGVISTNNREGKTEIHLEVWKGTTILNPVDWIAKSI